MNKILIPIEINFSSLDEQCYVNGQRGGWLKQKERNKDLGTKICTPIVCIVFHWRKITKDAKKSHFAYHILQIVYFCGNINNLSIKQISNNFDECSIATTITEKITKAICELRNKSESKRWRREGRKKNEMADDLHRQLKNITVKYKSTWRS